MLSFRCSDIRIFDMKVLSSKGKCQRLRPHPSTDTGAEGDCRGEGACGYTGEQVFHNFYGISRPCSSLRKAFLRERERGSIAL